MPELIGKIPEQQYEIVRDRIAEILSVEVPAQYAMYDAGELSADPRLSALNIQKVFIERAVPSQVEEDTVINVQLAFGDYDGANLLTHATQSDGLYSYFIDFYVKANAVANEDGTTQSRLKLQRLMGVARAILMAPHYFTLGFSKPSIGFRKITRLEMTDPKNDMDAKASSMGRLVFQVRVPETVELITPNELREYFTQVKHGQTELGHFYSNIGGNLFLNSDISDGQTSWEINVNGGLDSAFDFSDGKITLSDEGVAATYEFNNIAQIPVGNFEVKFDFQNNFSSGSVVLEVYACSNRLNPTVGNSIYVLPINPSTNSGQKTFNFENTIENAFIVFRIAGFADDSDSTSYDNFELKYKGS